MAKIILFIVLIFPILTFGQNTLFYEKDTIKFTQRTGGNLDSIDMSYSNQLSTFYGGSLNVSNNIISAQFIFQNKGFQNFTSIPGYKSMVFSGSPHLGFSYSFGSKGTQFLHFDFQQVLSKNRLLNINCQRNSSKGFLRNSQYTDNSFDFQIRKRSLIYSYLFQSSYLSKTSGLNGGILNDANIDQGLEFLLVRSQTANNSYKIANISLTNYFNTLKDSINGIGLVTKHKYDIISKEFIDNELNVKIREQYRLASIKTAGGVYFKTKNILFDALLQHRFWDYQNLSNHHQKNEINLTSSLQVRNSKYQFQNEASFNLIGAGGEWFNNATVQTKVNKIAFSGNVTIEQKWPEPTQRFYFSDNYNYKLNDYKLQSRIYTSGTINYKLKEINFIQLNFSNAILHNNYLFIDSTWRNDTMNIININSITLNANFKFGKLNFQPKITFNIPSKNFKYLSGTVLNTRVFIKKKMFKAKKMEAMYGVDVSWLSSYRLMKYNSSMDVFTFQNTSNSFTSMTNLSAFFGFSLGEFRFYTRFENIGYFWNDKTNQVLEGFPIQKNFVRLGLTWDFFN